MKLRLAVPDELRAEARRVTDVLAERDVAIEVVAGGMDAELVLRTAEGAGRAARAGPAVLLPSAEPRDVLVTVQGRSTTLDGLAAGNTVGLSGRLRREMLGVHRPDLRSVRVADAASALEMLRSGDIEAWIAASREVRSLALTDESSELLEPAAWATAVGRSTLVLYAEHAPAAVRTGLTALDDGGARAAFSAELAVLTTLDLGPGAPIGVLARPHGPFLRVRALVPCAEDRRLVRAEVSGSLAAAEEVGRNVAEQLLQRGAADLLAATTDR